jgi:uncharacterized protein (TIGR02284 family)
MTTTEEMVEVLNDLIMINNDRIEGYRTAIDETKDIDTDLKSTFNDMIDESRGYVSDLSAHVSSLGGEIETGTTNMGKIYRAWMDVKTAISGHDRKSILSACEFGEDAALKAYKQALEHDEELDTDTRSLIVDQRKTLKQSHDKIKAMRDSA